MKLFLIIGLFFSNLLFAQNIQIISDIDDTIKITALKDIRVISNALHSRAFVGFNTLYWNFLCPNQNVNQCNTTATNPRKITYVTGAPGFIKGLADVFLEKNKFPQPHNFKSREARGRDTLHFKIDTIKEMIKNDNDLKMNASYILVGDNGEADPEVYHQIQKLYPNQIKASFIHYIYDVTEKGKPLLGKEIPFLTSVDLAIHLFNLNVISKNDLIHLINDQLRFDGINHQEARVIKKVERAKKDYIAPKWVSCQAFFKNNYWPSLSVKDQGLNELIDKYKMFIQKDGNCH